MRRFRSTVLVSLLLLLLTTGVGFAGQANDRIDRWFVFGTNLAWFHNAYGSDIGPNNAEGWGTSFDARECETVFANLARMGCPLVRIWAFERQEGLTFTPDLTSDSRYPYHEVTGLDPVFLNNCRTLMAIAEKHRVYVYWSLLNHLIREEQGGRHLRIITDPKVRASYIRNAAVPFVTEFGRHPAFFAVDIINEADGAIGRSDFLSGCNKPNQGCTWKQMRLFIKECAEAFHQAVPGIRVTSTSGWHEFKNLEAGRFSGLGLDFYDWHSYVDAPNLPNAAELGLDRPVIIGEFGPKTEKPDQGYALQKKNWRAYIQQARKGYAGALSWSYGNPGAENNFVMVNADHSWRAGAQVLFNSTRGAVIPDAGPLMLTPEETGRLAAVHSLFQGLFASADDPLLSDGTTTIGGRFQALLNQARMYFPYVNPNYAAAQYANSIGSLADIGTSELRRLQAAQGAGSDDQASRRRVKRLQEVCAKLLSDIASSLPPEMREHDAVVRLAAFAQADLEAPAATRASPFEEGFTGAGPTR